MLHKIVTELLNIITRHVILLLLMRNSYFKGLISGEYAKQKVLVGTHDWKIASSISYLTSP
jgi:hypothetical protein